MRKRRLIGGNKVNIRVATFNDVIDAERIGYTNIYAVDNEGSFTTMGEIFINGEFQGSFETDENPYQHSIDCIKDGEWEKIE